MSLPKSIDIMLAKKINEMSYNELWLGKMMQVFFLLFFFVYNLLFRCVTELGALLVEGKGEP